MDSLAFIASLVGSLAWPALVLVLVLLFRAELRPLLRRPIHRAKAGPVEVEWEERRDEARVDLATSPEELEGPPTDRGRDHGPREARLAPPRFVVLAAFGEVEQALRQTLVEAGMDIGAPGRQGIRQLVDQAVAARVISEQTGSAIVNLTALRNLAAHSGGEDIDEAKAAEFRNLASGVLNALETARAKRVDSNEAG